MGCGSSVGQKTVIVVGGGHVGINAAKELDSKFHVTLIEPSDTFHHKIASLRGAVVPGWENRIRVPYNNLLKNGKVVRKEVREVTTGNVILSDGTHMQADYIVLAHGQGQMAFPIGGKPSASSSDVIAAMKQSQLQIKSASSIMIVGGGPVGVELAGEILAQHPGKNVTLVHSQPTLLNNSTPPIFPPAVAKVTDGLRGMGCTIRLNARVQNLPIVSDGSAFIAHDSTVTYTLTDNSTVDADLVVLCTGAAKRASNLVGAVNERNSVLVDEFLQVKGMPEVFCIGDANDVNESKLAYTGDLQRKVACKNIDNLSKGKAMEAYKPSGGEYGAMFIPLGPNGGVAAMGTSVMGDFAVKTIKSKGLFTGAVWKTMNATLPPVE